MTEPNFYATRANPNQALPLDSNHPIRTITAAWEGPIGPTFQQWRECIPRIITLIQETEALNELIPLTETVLTDTDDAFQALNHPVKWEGRDPYNPNLPHEDIRHCDAIAWALANILRKGKTIENRVHKIITAALTCLITKKQQIGQAELVGVATVSFPPSTFSPSA